MGVSGHLYQPAEDERRDADGQIAKGGGAVVMETAFNVKDTGSRSLIEPHLRCILACGRGECRQWLRKVDHRDISKVWT